MKRAIAISLRLKGKKLSLTADQIRKAGLKYHNKTWCKGHDDGCNHVLDAAEKCLDGTERLIDGAHIYPLPIYAQPRLNRFIEKLRKLVQVK